MFAEDAFPAHACEPKGLHALRSRSQMRRVAAQSPDTLIAEIERLRAELGDEFARSESYSDECRQLRARVAELEDALRHNKPAHDIYEHASNEINRLREALVLAEMVLPFREHTDEHLQRIYTANKALPANLAKQTAVMALARLKVRAALAGGLDDGGAG